MRRIAIVSFVILVVLAANTWARTWNVNAAGTGDAPTIQAAIDSCAQGDTVLAAPGTYKGAGNRDIDFGGKAITVTSLSGAEATIVDCAGSESEHHRGFYFHSGEDTISVLRGFTITNGYSGDVGGAIRCVGSSPKILDNVITANYADGGGGGIYCEGTHSLIRNNIIHHNEVTIMLAAARSEAAAALSRARIGSEAAFDPPCSGGNICCIADSSLIELNTISGGTGTMGSAILCSRSVVRVRRNDISENGGPYTDATVCFLSGSYDIDGNTIAGNSTWNNGAGLYCLGGTYRIVGNTIADNACFQSHGQGGGMYCETGDYTIENNDIMNNENCAGGGICIRGSGIVKNNRIHGNWALRGDMPQLNRLEAAYGADYDAGGGILVAGSPGLTVAGNTITGNHALWGGGIACRGGSPEIRDNIIAGNTAGHFSWNDNEDSRGGGLYCENSSPLITGNTIYSNSAGYYDEYENVSFGGGGGICCAGASSPTIRQNIIVDNRAAYELGIGGIYCEDAASTPVIQCCDVWGNENGDYGGTLGDQAGLNGNFSADPILCDPAHGDYGIHVLSPCAPGHHPDGDDCGLIGALGTACDFTATLLQGFTTSVDPSAVTITWTLAQAGEDLRCSVLRAEASSGAFEQLASSGIAREGMTFTFRDAGFDPGTAYRYRVDVTDDEGARVLFETTEIATPALPLTLDQNFPNPFNPSTTVSYYLPEDARVTLAIYAVSGERVAALVSGAEQKGRHAVVWNGKNDAGSPVASGIYFSRLTAGKETLSKKMILLR